MNSFRMRRRRALIASRQAIRRLRPTKELEEAEVRHELDRGLAAMPPRQRAAVVLTELLEFSSGEAEALGASRRRCAGSPSKAGARCGGPSACREEGASRARPAPAVADGIVYVSGAPHGGPAAIPQDCRSYGAVCDPIWTGDIHGSPTSDVIVSTASCSSGRATATCTRSPRRARRSAPPSQRLDRIVRPDPGDLERPSGPRDRHDGTLRALTVDGHRP